MLHDMLRAAAATEDRLIGEAKTARLLRRLPLADLYKLATTGSLEEPGAEAPDGDSWVLRFAGTPLAGAATELATHELELDTQIAQNRSLGEGVLAQKDQLAIQKRLLEIELVRAQTAEAEKAEAEEAAAAEQQQAAPEAGGEAAPPAAPPGAAPAAPPPAPGGDPAAPPKMAGAGGKALEAAWNLAYSPAHAAAANIGNRAGMTIGGLGGLAHGLQKDEEGKRHWGRGIAEGIGGAAIGGHLGGLVGGTGSRVRDGAGVLEGVKGHYAGLRSAGGSVWNAAQEVHMPTPVAAPPKTAAITDKAIDALKKGLATDRAAVSAAARRHLEDVGGATKPTEKKEASLLPAKATGLARVGQVFSGSRVPQLEHASDMLTRAGKRTSADVLQRAADTEILKTVGARGAAGLAGATAIGVAAKKALGSKPAAEQPATPADKVAGLLDSGRALLSRGHELVTGSGVHALEGKARELGTTLEGKTRELTNARDVALHRSGEAERILSRGPSLYKGKVVLPEPTREARMRAAREVNEHGATAERLGKEIADTTASTNKAIADTHAAAETEKRKVMGTRVGLVAAPVALGTLAASSGTPAADPTKIAMVGQALQGLLSGRAGKVVNFALEHPTAAAGIAGGAVGGLGGAMSTDAQGHHSLGRTLAGAAGGAATAAGAQQAYANRGAISEAAQKAVAGIKSRIAGAKPAAVVDPGAGI